MTFSLIFVYSLAAEYIPFEKRPKQLFHGKSSTEFKYSTKTRRLKQFHTNVIADEEKYLERTKKRLTKLNKKIQKLTDLGIMTQTDYMSNKKLTDSGDNPDKVLKSRVDKIKTVENQESHPVELSRKKSLRNTQKLSELSLDSSVNVVDQNLKKKKGNSKSGIVKKKISKRIGKVDVKLASLNADTVKRIARELIRKKGPSLLRFPASKTKSSKKKSK